MIYENMESNTQLNHTLNWFNASENQETQRNIPYKKDPLDFTQFKLFPTNIFDYLPKDHDYYVYFKNILFHPNTTAITFTIRSRS